MRPVIQDITERIRVRSAATRGAYLQRIEQLAGRHRGADRFSPANVAHAEGLGVNAGHDLDLRNLTVFHALPHLDEVSIGHALIAHALHAGLRQAVQDYLAALGGRQV